MPAAEWSGFLRHTCGLAEKRPLFIRRHWHGQAFRPGGPPGRWRNLHERPRGANLSLMCPRTGQLEHRPGWWSDDCGGRRDRATSSPISEDLNTGPGIARGYWRNDFGEFARRDRHHLAYRLSFLRFDCKSAQGHLKGHTKPIRLQPPHWDLRRTVRRQVQARKGRGVTQVTVNGEKTSTLTGIELHGIHRRCQPGRPDRHSIRRRKALPEGFQRKLRHSIPARPARASGGDKLAFRYRLLWQPGQPSPFCQLQAVQETHSTPASL